MSLLGWVVLCDINVGEQFVTSQDTSPAFITRIVKWLEPLWTLCQHLWAATQLCSCAEGICVWYWALKKLRGVSGCSVAPFVYVPSQWETTLHWSVFSHWLGTYTLAPEHQLLPRFPEFTEVSYASRGRNMLQRKEIYSIPEKKKKNETGKKNSHIYYFLCELILLTTTY